MNFLHRISHHRNDGSCIPMPRTVFSSFLNRRVKPYPQDLLKKTDFLNHPLFQTVLQRLSQVRGGDVFFPSQIRNRASQFEYAVIGAGRKLQLVYCPAHGPSWSDLSSWQPKPTIPANELQFLVVCISLFLIRVAQPDSTSVRSRISSLSA